MCSAKVALSTYLRFLAGKWKNQDGSKWEEIEVLQDCNSFKLFSLVTRVIFELSYKTCYYCHLLSIHCAPRIFKTGT